MQVAVLGAGEDGRAIAGACVTAGYGVRLHADDATAAMDAVDAIEGRLDETGEVPADPDGTIARLEATTDLDAAVDGADVVVEAVTDDVETLQARLADLEGTVDRETLVTTATPVSVTAAAAGLRHPDRALGLWFHLPVEISLVEVIVAEQTDRTAIERAETFVSGLGVPSVVVRDTPGGVATRLALALEVEAMWLLAENIADAAAVDEALRHGYDHPIGPLERADRAGLDDRLATLERLADALGEKYRPPPLLSELVEAGRTGAGVGEGFYVWEDGAPVEPALSGPEVTAHERRPQDPTSDNFDKG